MVIDLYDPRFIGFSAFAVGTVLDFMLIGVRDNLWLWTRSFWNGIDTLKIRSFHKQIAKFILSYADKGEEEGVQAYLFLFVIMISSGWSLFSAAFYSFGFIGKNGYADYVLVQLTQASLFLFTLALILCFFILSMVGLSKFYNIKSKIIDKIGSYFVYAFTGVAIFCSIAPFIIMIYPPAELWRTAIGYVFFNAASDFVSIAISLKILRFISKRGPLSAIFGAITDITSASLLGYVVVSLMISVFKIQGLSVEGDFSLRAGYGALIAVSALIPTILLAFIILSAGTLKIIQALIVCILKYSLNLVAHPDDVTHVRPFTMLGGYVFLFTWAFHIIKDIL